MGALRIDVSGRNVYVDGGADGWLEFDYVPGEWEVRSRSADVGGKLVVIGSKMDEAGIAALFGV